MQPQKLLDCKQSEKLLPSIILRFASHQHTVTMEMPVSFARISDRSAAGTFNGFWHWTVNCHPLANVFILTSEVSINEMRMEFRSRLAPFEIGSLSVKMSAANKQVYLGDCTCRGQAANSSRPACQSICIEALLCQGSSGVCLVDVDAVEQQ